LCAVFSVWISEMPRPFAGPLSLIALMHGSWIALTESRRTSRQLLWPIEGPPQLDGVDLLGADLSWRGPLAFLRWRDASGQRGRLAWWPDTLPRYLRREWKLADAARAGTRAAVSMAP
jgi:toxin CptA